MKRILVVLLSLAATAMCTMVWANGKADPAKAPEGGKVHVNSEGKTYVTVALSEDPGTLDPAMYGAIHGIDAIAPMVRESLYERDGILIPQIAKSQTVDGDNLTYHVEIYDYIYDSEGNHMTADDVVFCFNRAKENNFNSTSFYDSVKKEGDYKVAIKLNNTTVGVFDQVAQVQALYTKAAYDAAKGEFGTHPVFTGPYKITEWVSGSSVTLEKNEKYWQKEELRNIYAPQNVDIINFVVIKDSAQLAIALETGRVDMVDNLDSLEADRFKDKKGFEVWEFTNRETQFMYLSQSKTSPFYGDLNLRKAVMNGVDMDSLIVGAVNGNAVPVKSFGNPMVIDYQKAWDAEPYFDFDLDFAKKCLSQSQYKGQTVRIMVSGNPLHSQMALLLQGMLYNVGIKSEILTYENALFNTYKYDETQWDIMFDQTSWSGPLPTQWRDKFDRRTFKNGKGGFIATDDDKFQALLEAATNVETYSPEAVNAFHQYLKDQSYARGLFNQRSMSVTTDIVTDFMNHRIGVMFPAGCTYTWND